MTHLLGEEEERTEAEEGEGERWGGGREGGGASLSTIRDTEPDLKHIHHPSD